MQSLCAPVQFDPISDVIAYTKALDRTRPTTLVVAQSYEKDLTVILIPPLGLCLVKNGTIL